MKRSVLLVVLLALGPLSAQEGARTGQHAFVHSGTFDMNYLLFLPADYGQDPSKRWPLIYFHHGRGEIGGDVSKLKAQGPPGFVEDQPDFPFVVLSPQLPQKQPSLNDAMTELSGLLDQVVADYAIDDRRIYVTGLSLGGVTTWLLAHFFPDRFAAIAPIAAGYAGFVIAECSVRDVPIWMFHGRQDGQVPIADAERLAQELVACGADIRFTAFEDAGHASTWQRAYRDQELYDWFLSHRLPVASGVVGRSWGELKVDISKTSRP